MHSIAVAVRRELIKNGLITVDHVNPRTTRKEVKQSHGFRKFFETMLVNSGIHETIIRKLTGHSDSNNLTQLYSKQTEEEMLLEYGKAIEVLTINPENRLTRKVTELTEQQDEITLMKLSHEKDMKEMREQMNHIVSLIQENPKLAKVKTEVLSEI